MQFDIKQVLVGGFTILCTATAGGWALGTYLRGERVAELQRTVDAYEKSEQWNLPKTLESIRTASALLAQQLASLRAVGDLEREAAKLREAVSAREKEVADLKGGLAAAKADLDEKEAFIKSLHPRDEPFTIATRKSATVAGTAVVVGVSGVRSESVEVVVNNQNHSLKSGQFVPVVAGQLRCRLIVVEIGYFRSPEAVDFRLVCDPTR